MKDKILKHYKFIIIIILIIALFNIKFPYYIEAPGGVIDITKRVTLSDDYNPSGTLNLLYVTEYEATIPTLLASVIFSDYDIEKNSERTISDESTKEVYNRNKIMLDNSLQNAIYVAYTNAGKSIGIKDYSNIVIATTEENNLEIGDVILKVDDKIITDIQDIKSIISSKNVGDEVSILLNRGGKEKNVISKVLNGNIIGAAIVTNYEYTLDPDIDIKFKSKESGASGGLMLSLTIYNAISGTDIIKSRNIGGTGTIDKDGNVGEIDGIKYKIIGAVKNDIDLIFVPKENYKEALKVKKEKNYDIKIISVSTFNEAIEYLTNN